MKTKILTLAFTAFFAAASFAQDAPKTQDLTSKKGEKILPEAGDYAVGIDAAPFLNYFGAFLSNAGGVAPTANFLNNNAIFGKYYVDAKTAYRGMLRIGVNSLTTKHLYDTTTITAPAYLEDSKTATTKNITLGAGIEKRKGNGRLQGFYGADLLFTMASSKNTYKYAEAVSATNTTHTNSFFQGAGVITAKNGTSVNLTARAFIGAEYFFLPKFSLGCELGWGLGYTVTGKGKTEVESFSVPQGKAAAEVNTAVTNTGGSHNLCIDTDNGFGKLALYFHF